MNEEKFTGWIASLSDGREVYETQPIPGERSSWQRLIQLTKDTDVRITMLRLNRGEVKINAMRDADGYMQAYEAFKALYSGEARLRQGIGSVVGDKVFITWVNDFGNVWHDVQELSNVIMHTTLRD